MSNDYKVIDQIMDRYGNKVENLLPILLEVQESFDTRFIEGNVADYMAKRIGIPNAQMSEVLSFFAAINKKPKGKYHIEMCNSTVCRVNDNFQIEAYLQEALGIKVGETSEDGLFSLDYAPCFGACDISPSIRINKHAHGKLTMERLAQIISDLKGEIHE